MKTKTKYLQELIDKSGDEGLTLNASIFEAIENGTITNDEQYQIALKENAGVVEDCVSFV